jgi:hypothetical protein
MPTLPAWLRPALAALLLAAAAPAAAQPVQEDAPGRAPGATSLRLGIGWTGYGFTRDTGARAVQQGVALQARFRHMRTRTFGVDFNLTWGLTDWDRAKVWIDRGNEAGQWTTERIKAVGDWAMEVEDEQGLRLMGAFFADFFLVMTYAAVPACYVASVGGATSHLQADATATVHAGEGRVDVWGEAGGVGLRPRPGGRDRRRPGAGTHRGPRDLVPRAAPHHPPRLRRRDHHRRHHLGLPLAPQRGRPPLANGRGALTWGTCPPRSSSAAGAAAP